MCLDTVDKVTKEYTEGYKIFEVVLKGELVRPELYDTYKRFPLHEWVEDNSETYIYYNEFDTEFNNFYKSGFHFFVNLKDAYAWMGDSTDLCGVFKVKVRNIVASGKQRLYGIVKSKNAKVGVAKEMYIEEEVT